MLTQEQLKEVLHYDPETGHFTWYKKQKYSSRIGLAGSKHSSGYMRITVLGVRYYSHRLAWFYVYGIWPKEIDHINHIRDDNRLLNLRSISHAENTKNQSIRSDNISGIAGVCWMTRDKVWKSSISLDEKPKHLGSFKDKFEAICCRKSAENKYGFHPNHGSI